MIAIAVRCVLLLALCVGPASAQEPHRRQGRRGRSPRNRSKPAIEKLGTLEFPVRMEAARTVRRAGAVVAVPLLTSAGRSHKDGYVRFRALVLLSGFNDRRTHAK